MRKGTEKRPPCGNAQVKLDAENYESKIGIAFAEKQETRVGYLANVKSTTHIDENKAELAAIIMYFVEESG